MSERFYCGAIQAETGSLVRLSGPEMHHLVHVMRAKVGDRVILFDGLGREFYTELVHINKQFAELRILSWAEVSRELPAPLWIAAALPKGDRQRWLVEKLVELGVACFVPLITDRSVVRPTEETLDRLRRTVVEASKQCGRNKLMEVTPPERWNRFCVRTDLPPLRILAHPVEARKEVPPADVASPTSATEGPFEPGQVALSDPRQLVSGVVFAVGPEGGFSPAEVALAIARGWRVISLGERILRVETAAVMLASLVAGKLAGLI
ncbi:MAG: 16S rRNA (uracil(1498)-N(3))-methyltransferase [Thermoguttaceae bacterium]|nr:16S rRNA (uracil(1498)-N(3))-methyltransferase [Thermoguttaceae bacterium]MDW8078006.1 RsmE family RNA methyltransferase [Thermoguttaceae bacterium]